MVVDATWDRPLARVGFPVNDSWDGVGDTRVAVEPLGRLVHETAEDHMGVARTYKSSWSADNNARTERFTSALNSWLEEIRKNS